MTTPRDENIERGLAIDSLNRAISLLVKRAKKFGADRARELDPTLPAHGYSVLMLLYSRGPHRAQQIAEIYELDKGAVSRYVQQLIDLQLLVRTPDPSDKRATLLDISEHGRQRLDDIFSERRNEMVSKLLADWSPDRVRNLAAELDAYNAALDPDTY